MCTDLDIAHALLARQFAGTLVIALRIVAEDRSGALEMLAWTDGAEMRHPDDRARSSEW